MLHFVQQFQAVLAI